MDAITPPSIIPFTPRESIETAFIGRGLYRLYLEGAVVYVGQARCISGRIHVHKAEGLKEFTDFDYVLMVGSQFEIDEAEASEIFRLKPRYNRAIPRTGRYRRLQQIAHALKIRPRVLQDYITQKNIQAFLGLYDSKEFDGVAL